MVTLLCNYQGQKYLTFPHKVTTGEELLLGRYSLWLTQYRKDHFLDLEDACKSMKGSLIMSLYNLVADMYVRAKGRAFVSKINKRMRSYWVNK